MTLIQEMASSFMFLEQFVLKKEKEKGARDGPNVTTLSSVFFMCNSPFSFLSTTILCKRQVLKRKVFLQVLSLVRYLKYLLDYPFLYDFKFLDNWTLDSIGLLTLCSMQNEQKRTKITTLTQKASNKLQRNH